MKSGMTRTKRLTADALLLTTAFILSWIEIMISLPAAVPGIKIGLANLAILFAMYYCGNADAFFVLVGRIILSAFLFGNVSSLIIGAAGGMLSFAVMALIRKLFGKHIVYVSIMGGVFHNIGQLTAASFMLGTSFIMLLPYLISGGIAAGAFNGIIADRILKFSLTNPM